MVLDNKIAEETYPFCITRKQRFKFLICYLILQTAYAASQFKAQIQAHLHLNLKSLHLLRKKQTQLFLRKRIKGRGAKS